MKRLLTSAVLFLCCIATSFAQFSGSGSGTENDPYLILNPIQLNQMRNFLNQSGVYFKLMANIDLTEFLEDESPTQGWLPVGTSSTPFKGILDGNGYTISGLWINRSNSDYVGLLGKTYEATIKNLTLTSVIIRGKNYVGGFIGACQSNMTTITNCISSGEVSGTSYVGGFCGKGSTLNGCYSYTNVYGTEEYVGGLCGFNVGNISNCVVSDAVVDGNDEVGGLVGCFYGNIANYAQDSNFRGKVSGRNRAGGLAGSFYGVVRNCFVIGDIIATGDEVGGLIGSSSSYYTTNSHTNSYFRGYVCGKTKVGGLIGSLSNSISKCYSYASVVGENQVGGLCGYYNYSTIQQNVFAGFSINALEDEVGRLYGKESGFGGTIGGMGTSNENKAYNKTIVIKAGVAQEILDDIQNGTGVSATTLKLKATYVGMDWDFTDTWAIQETECYPYLKYQTAPPKITSQVISGATTVSGQCVDGATITLEIDGVKQQMVSTGNTFSFTVPPLQAGREVRLSAKAANKEQSYYTTQVVSYLGSGTEEDPYQIYTAVDLTGVYRNGYYKLMNDIDLTSYINQYSATEGWESIGREGSETIHFDGNGHTISGLWCNSTRDNTGLFSCFANGTIKNLTVVTAEGKQVKGGSNTGILIGKMINGTIEDCCVQGTVADGTPVGGMVGLFDGGTITNCQANVTISTTLATSYVGGLVGEITGGTIDQCFTDGTMTATGSTSYVGGLIGKNSATVTNSYSNAAVTSSYNAAGLIAYNYGLVEKCYATGDLNSNNYAAGVIGYSDGTSAVIRKCAAMNNIIEITYESQQVQQGGGYGQRIIGGIKNSAPAPEMNNYALSTMQVSVNNVPQVVYNDIMNGTAKTAAELTAMATYQELDWDFDDVWNIEEGTGYPNLTDTTAVNPADPSSGGGNENNNVPDTDISSLANVIYINNVEAKVGSQITLPINMKNTAEIRGFQFDLYLPEGVTVAKNNIGRIIGGLSADRKPEYDQHTLTISEQDDGAIRFLCGSQYDETFTGTDGEIATLTVNIADDVEDGDYAIILRTIKLTETNISNYYETSYVKSTLSVSSYMLGDINSDQQVDVSDYIGIANHILGNTPEGFVEKAGDVNEDDAIDVSDYIGVANIIMTGSIYGNSNNSRATMRRASANEMDNAIYISPFTTENNTQMTLSFKMKNSAEIRGFQFDLYLPEGVTAARHPNNNRILGSLSSGRKTAWDEHTLTLSEQTDGAIRFLCGSQYDETFTGTDGEIATLIINIADNVSPGNYSIYLKNMKLTETDITKFYETKKLETTMKVVASADTRTMIYETSTVAPEAANNVNLRVIRTLNADEWSTICLPFAMTEAQVKAAFGNDVLVGDFTGCNVDGDKVTVNFDNTTAIAANHPYIIKVSSAITEFTVDGVDVVPGVAEVKVDGSGNKYNSFVGTYENGKLLGDGCLFLSGNQFYFSNGSTRIKGLRAYFDLDAAGANTTDASRIFISFDETTGIKDVKSVSNDKVYNLSGQQVKNPAKGIYVKEGKKVIIK